MKDEDAVGYLSGDGDGEASVGPEVVDGKDGGRKEKAVKVKKIFLRILRKVMDVPQDSPLVRDSTVHVRCM